MKKDIRFYFTQNVEYKNFTYDADDNVNTQTSSLDTSRTDGSLNSIYLNQATLSDAETQSYDNNFYDTNIGARYGLNTETANMNPTFT